jgi:hypothetical protein
MRKQTKKIENKGAARFLSEDELLRRVGRRLTMPGEKMVTERANSAISYNRHTAVTQLI